MSWFGSASEWKQGLSSSALSKVEELENQVERLKRERVQKQNQLDSLQQALDNQKRKTDDGVKEQQTLQKEIEQLSRSCEQLQLQLQKGQHDHITSSISLMPLRKTAAVESLSSCSGDILSLSGAGASPPPAEASTTLLTCDSAQFSLGPATLPAEGPVWEEMESLRKKVEELMQENKSLHSKLSDQMLHYQNIDGRVSSSSSSSVGDDDKDFWGSFEKINSRNQRTPSKTPRKAIETSDENPFKAPFEGLQSKAGLGMNDGNLLRAPTQHPALSTLPSAPPPVTTNDDYSKQLEKMIEEYKMEIDGLKSSSSALPDVSKLQEELTSREKTIKAANEQLATFKSNCEEVAGKLEKTEQRLRAVQSELDCQRHNSEAARKNLDDKWKERERELTGDMTRAQNDMVALERRVSELQTKLQQQETLTRNTQNSLQASLDKALAQTVSLEKDCKTAVSRSSQLEAEIARLEKTAEDSAKTLTMLRQDKEMAAAQVSGLKVKLSAAELSIEKLTTRVELAEKVADSSKVSLEQIQADKDKAVKEAENNITKLSQEMSQLEEELRSTVTQREDARAAVNKTREECERKLAGITAMEAEVSEMRALVSSINAEMESVKADAASAVESTKAEAAKEILKVKEETEKQVGEAERRAKVAEEEKLEVQNKEDIARGERLTAEVSKWELEGTIDTLKADIARHNETISSLKAEIEVVMNGKVEAENHLEEQIKEKEANIDVLTSAVEAKRRRISELEKTCQEVEEKLDTLARDKEQGETRLKELQQQHADSIAALTNTVEEKEKRISELEKMCQEVEEKLDTLTRDKEQGETRLKELQQQHADSIAALTNAVEEKERALTESNNEVKTLTLRLATEHTEKMEVVDQLDKLKVDTEEKLNDLQVALEDTMTDLETVLDNKHALEHKCQNNKEEFLQLLAQKQLMEGKYEEEQKQHAQKITNMKQLLEINEGSLEKNKKEIENLKAQLENQKAENDQLAEANRRINSDNEKKLSIVQAALEVAENHSCSMKEQVQTLNSQVDQLSVTFEKKAEGLVQENADLQLAVAELRSTLEDLSNEHQDKSNKLKEAEQEICLLQVSIEEKSSAFKEAASALIEKENLIKEKEMEITNIIAREKQLEKLVEAAANNFRESKGECETLTASLKEAEEQLSQSKNSCQLLNEELDILRCKVEAAADEILALKEDIITKSQQLSKLEVNALCAEEAVSRAENLEEELKKWHEKHREVVAQYTDASAAFAAKEEECTELQATIVELENNKNAIIQSLQDKQSLLDEEKKALLEKLNEEKEKGANASTNNLEVQKKLDDKLSQLAVLQEELGEQQSTICRLKEALSGLEAEQHQWQEEQCSLRSAVVNIEQAKNNLESEIENLHNDANLRAEVESLQEVNAALNSRHEEMVVRNEQLESSLREASEELKQERISLMMLQEQLEQHTTQTDEVICSLTDALASTQRDIHLKKSELEDLTKQQVVTTQECEEAKCEVVKVKEQLDTAMRTLQTAKSRMIDSEVYDEVCKEKEDLRERINGLHEEYIMMTNKYQKECEKVESLQKDFDNYRDAIRMMGHQQDNGRDNEVAEIQKENADLIGRLEKVERTNGELHRTVCAMKRKETHLAIQLHAAMGASVTTPSTSQAEAVEAAVVVSLTATPSTSQTESGSSTANNLEATRMQVTDAESTVASQRHVTVTAEETEALEMGNETMDSEMCDQLTSAIVADELDASALKRQLGDLKSQVAAKELLLEEMKENMQTLRKELEHLANHNHSLVAQLEERIVNTSIMSSDGEQKERSGDVAVEKIYNDCIKENTTALQSELEHVKEELKVSQEQFESVPSMKEQLESEANETKEKLNQALYDLRITQEQNKLNSAMAQELEDKVNSLEAELKVAVEKREQLQEENVKLRLSSDVALEDSWTERQTESSSAALTRLEEEKNDLQEKYKSLKEELDKMFEKHENYNVEFEESNNKSEELAFLNEELSSKNDELASKNDLLITKNEELTVMIDEMKNEVAELMCQNNVLKSNTETLYKKEEELLAENENFAAQKSDLDTQIQTTSQKLEEVMSGNRELVARNTEVVLQNERLVAQNQSLQASLTKNCLDIEELVKLKESVNILRDEKDVLEKKLSDCEVAVLENAQSKNALENEKEKLLDSVKALEDKVNQSRNKCIELANQIEILEAERDKLISSCDIISCEKKELVASSQELTVMYTTIVAEREDILKENMELCSEKQKLQLEKNDIMNCKEELLSEKEQLQSKLEHMEKEKDELLMEKESLESQQDKLKLEGDLIIKDKIELEARREYLESKMKEMEREKEELESEKEILVKQNADLNSKVNVMLNDKINVLFEKEKIQAEKDLVIKEKNELLSEKEDLQIEKQELLAEKDIIFNDKQKVLSENSRLQSENEQNLKEKEVLLSESELLSTEKEQLLKTVEDITSQKDMMTSQQLKLQGEIISLSGENEQITLNMHELKIKHEQKELAIDKLNNNIANLTSSKESLMSEKDQLTKINEQQLQEMVELVTKISTLQHQIKNISSQKENLSSQVTQLLADKHDITSKIEHLKSDSKDLLAEKVNLAKNLEDTRTRFKLVEHDNESQSKALESQKIEIKNLQNTIQDFKQQQQIQEKVADTLRTNLNVKEKESMQMIKEHDRLKEELCVIRGELKVAQTNFANKLNETTNLMVEKASLEVELASVKDKLSSSAADTEKCLAAKDAKIEELRSLVEEARTDLDVLQAKFSLNKKIIRKKEEELNAYMIHIGNLETEEKKLKEKVEHWQKRFNEKNTEAEEQACQNMKVMMKMHDLQETNDNLKSKILLLQAQIKKLKSNSDSKEASAGESSRQRRNTKVTSCITASHANDPVKERTDTQPSQVSDSQEIVGSSQPQVNVNSSVSQMTRRAVTRRASMLSLSPSSSSVTLTNKAPKNSPPERNITRSRKSAGANLDEKPVPKPSVNKIQTRRSHSHSSIGTTSLGDDTMKHAMKRVLSSTSTSKDKKKRRSGTVVVPESPSFVQTLSKKFKQGLNYLPSGDVECPGVVHRSNTLSKKAGSREKLQDGGPLKSLNPNSPIRASSRSSQNVRSSSVTTRSRASCSTTRGEECKTQ